MSIRTNLTLRAAAVFAVVASVTPPLLAAQRGSSPKIDVALTYAASHSNHTTGATLWLQGGGLDVNALFFHGLGLGASGTGLHASSSNPSIASLDLVVLTFGPTYTFHPMRRLSIYSEALVGEANGFHSVFAHGSGPTTNPAVGTTNSANSLALQAGGAVDIDLSHHLSLRAAQVDYFRTQLPNGSNDIQNNVRFAAGLVARFGR